MVWNILKINSFLESEENEGPLVAHPDNRCQAPFSEIFLEGDFGDNVLILSHVTASPQEKIVQAQDLSGRSSFR